MPINLEEIVADAQGASAASVFTPKFFSSSITGNGGKIGWLSQASDPGNVKPGFSPNDDPDVKRYHRTDSGVDVRHVPMYMIPASAWQRREISTYDFDAAEWTQVGELVDPTLGTAWSAPLLVDVTMHSLIMEDDAQNGHAKRMVAFYRVMACVRTNDQCPRCEVFPKAFEQGDAHFMLGQPTNPMFAVVTADPVGVVLDAVHALERNAPSYVKVDKQALDDFCDSLSAYELACRAARMWNETLDAEFSILLRHCVDGKGHVDKAPLLARQVRMLESHHVPLPVYMRIYEDVKAQVKDDEAKEVCKENLNLMLSDVMSDLEAMKPHLAAIPDLTAAQRPTIDPKFSYEQAGAITATSPLVMTQAAAGTGKSSVVLARIRYMCDAGVEPSDITVLSFTNAAADHITELNPDVNSMTIAKMIHLIYTENYDHRLSTLDTLINAVDIYYGMDPTARIFRKTLIDVKHNETGSFTGLNRFVEQNFDWVMGCLAKTGQTTLELEIIITHQNLENMKEPADVTSRHLIIDEVQDCSVFEFVFALDYVRRHQESLFIVGDASQTLYEFRAANPRALNVMEASGVFETYPLQVNFRSNQEILDMANMLLGSIEANSYAQLRLRANSLAKVTPESFQEKVDVTYLRVSTQKEFNEHFNDYFQANVYAYVADCRNKGEQVCLLAYSNRHVKMMKDWLEANFDDEVVSLVNERSYPSTVFSACISKYADELRKLDPRSCIGQIIAFIDAHIDRLTGNAAKTKTAVAALCSNWAREGRSSIQLQYNQLYHKKITRDQFFDFVFDHMLNYEIQHNDMKQVLVSNRNAERKKNHDAANAPLLVSTIHGAKGLEFPHTVVLYKDDSRMSEENKRMYYVALTRAQQSECVLAYGTTASSDIKEAYWQVVERYGGDRDDG